VAAAQLVQEMQVPLLPALTPGTASNAPLA
jgi:hypothetical protein